MKKTERNKGRMLRALEETPFVEQACRKVGISRATFYRWCEQDRKFYYRSEAARIKGREKLNDYAESKLLENIKIGHQGAIQFWLINNSKVYQMSRATNIRRMEQIKQEEFERNKELLELYDDTFGEAITLLGGDPEVLGKAIKAAIKGDFEWMLKHDQDKDV